MFKEWWRSIHQHSITKSIPEGFILEKAEIDDRDLENFIPLDPQTVKDKKLRKRLIDSALFRIEIIDLNSQTSTIWLECPDRPQSETHAYYRITKTSIK